MTDTELLDWLGEQWGVGLINDDNGRWACVWDGIQPVPDVEPQDMDMTFCVKAEDWKLTVREAILAAMREVDEGEAP